MLKQCGAPMPENDRLREGPAIHAPHDDGRAARHGARDRSHARRPRPRIGGWGVSDPDCPRCRGLEHPVETLLAAFIWTPEVARSPMVKLAVTMYLRNAERDLAEWLIRDIAAHAEDQVAQRARLKAERPRLMRLYERAAQLSLEVAHAAPIAEILDRLAAGVAFPAMPEKRPRKRKPKPRAWERTLRLDRDNQQDPAA